MQPMASVQPKVSIIMPVYNGGSYFELALQSALDQTYGNCEIVVVNDGSADMGQTDRIAQRYADRITYISQENRGVAGALNTAINHMTGDFFTWLSHDDLFLPQKTARQVDFFRSLNKEDACLFGNYYLIDERGTRINHVQFDLDQFVSKPMLPLLRGCINGCTVFVPAWIMREFGPFDESLRYSQDYDLWNKVLRKHEFFFQPETLISYRIHAQQGTQNPAAAKEGDNLWVRMMSARSETERVQLFGSSMRFYSEMAIFLENTPYKGAAEHARQRATAEARAPLVSVVMPLFNEAHLALRAARSALNQSYPHIELVIVDDGSTESIAAIEHLASTNGRVRLIRQKNSGPGAARNIGMMQAAGSYLAFLDADDMFVPTKIQRQLTLMQESGHVISHTSYRVSYPERFADTGVLSAGTFSGKVFPQILSECPIATPTVMMHRSLLSEGFAFPTGTDVGEDVFAWIWAAMRHPVLGIDEPLSIVEWSSTSSALNIQKTIRGLAYLLARIVADPVLAKQGRQISALRLALDSVIQRVVSNDGRVRRWTNGAVLNEEFIAHLFSANSPSGLAEH